MQNLLPNRAEELDRLIYETFSDDPGSQLLELWKEALIMNPAAIEGQDLVGVGIKEGMNRFIRNIVLTLARMERPSE